MFFCEKCRNENQWPDSLFKSRGKCEVCDQFATCNDVPSKYLPLPPAAKPSNDYLWK